MQKNSLYNLTGTVIRILIGLASIPILISNLGSYNYGIWIILTSFINILMLADGGFSTTTTYFILNIIPSDNKQQAYGRIILFILGIILIISLLLILSIFSLSSFLISQYFKNVSIENQTELILSVKLLGFIVNQTLFQQVFIGILQAFDRYGTVNFIRILQFTLTQIGYICISYYYKEINVMIYWNLAISCFITFVFFISSQKSINIFKLNFTWDKKVCTEILYYCFMSWLSYFGGVLFSNFDKVIIGYLLGPITSGIYGTLTNILTYINLFSSISIQPLISLISGVVNQKNNLYHIRYAVLMNSFLAFSLGICFVGFANEIIFFLLKTQPTDEIIFIFNVGTIVYTFYSLNALGYYLLLGTGNVKIVTYSQIFGGVLSLSLIYWGCKTDDLRGAMIGNCGFMCTLFMNYYALHLFRIKFQEYLRWITIPAIIFMMILFLNLFTNSIIGRYFFSISGLIVICIWAFKLKVFDIKYITGK